MEVNNLINGRMCAPQSDHRADVFNPSTGERIAQVSLSSADECRLAVNAASAALRNWRNTPVVDRARVMFRYRELLELHFDQIAQLITTEHGKTVAESRAELKRGIEVVEFACGIPSLFMGQTLANIASDVDSDVQRHPVGVCLGITPYNFPAMVPMWMFPIALVCGNTFILKPSEKVPLSAMKLGELLHEAGCPDGVFNVVHGDRTAVESLLNDPDLAAVSFVGSTPAAKAVYAAGTTSGKRVQAAGGAKNFCLIMPDADPDLAVKALAAASYGCGGQRCMATSIAVPVGGIADSLVDRLSSYAASLSVGPTHTGDNVDMGPLIRRDHVDYVSSCLDQATQDGAAIALDGRQQFEGNGFLLGPSVVDHVSFDSRIAREEIFGPVLSVIRAQTLDEAIRLSHQCKFGNGASIFTSSGASARRFREEFNAGMIGVNVGVPAPMAWFPFTGWNGSFFGDLHVQGSEGIQFYTRQKVTLTRWPQRTDDFEDPIWSSGRD